ncbi:MAG: type 1 glutamine amidotransferase [Chitinophagaceae bacterium]|nr:type 1 glutamine amidotransferase [Chitinophagaceae bacterium]
MHIHFIQHVSFEYPGSIIRWAAEHGHTTSFTKPFEHSVFPSMDLFDLLIILGGPMGIYEEEKFPWIADEKKFIRASIAADKKILGICLGSQLIAHVLGAKVVPHILQEIGWWPVLKTNNHPLTESLPGEFISFHLHGDTFDLPEGAEQLFRTKGCEQQGFIYKNKVAAIQFHPEIEQELLQNMMEHEKGSFIQSTYVQSEEEIRKHIPQQLPLQPTYMQAFLENFVKL